MAYFAHLSDLLMLVWYYNIVHVVDSGRCHDRIDWGGATETNREIY